MSDWAYFDLNGNMVRIPRDIEYDEQGHEIPVEDPVRTHIEWDEYYWKHGHYEVKQ